MKLSPQKIQQVADFCLSRPDMFLSSFKVKRIDYIDGDGLLFLDTEDKRSPRVICVRGSDRDQPFSIIPYFLIHERPEAQAVSFLIGQGVCNLAEIRELSGTLFSRYCGSYVAEELPQKDAIQSKIALWVQDCLTQDLDHQTDLNRKRLPGGASISYDFGLSFMRHFYPPFYTAELGISDESVGENKEFLLELLARYAVRSRQSESRFIERLTGLFPTSCRVDLCRYYFRNFCAYFSKRLYCGQFFNKLKDTPFDEKDVREIVEVAGLCLNRVNGWRDLTLWLSMVKKKTLDLRDLDLSCADLRKADLKGADLRGTNLNNANLAKADLRGAGLCGTSLDGVRIKKRVAECPS